MTGRTTYNKNIRRTIMGSMGRYIAILAIIALGVGFFAGVKNTRSAMLATCNKYVSDYNMYDYRLLSTYGFTEEDQEAFSQLDSVKRAAGSISADFFSVDDSDNSLTIRAHAITEGINDPDIVAGRMPEADNEALGDSLIYSEDDIGKTIKVSDENDETARDSLTYDEYTLVGIMESPYYMMKEERGTTSIGDGKVDGYIYMPRGGFTSEYFTEMLIVCKNQGYVYSDEYNDNIKAAEKEITEAAESRGEERYREIVSQAQEEIDSARNRLEEGRQQLESEKNSAYARLSESKNTLNSRSRQLEESREQLASQKSQLTQQKSQVQSGISQARAALAAAEGAGDEELTAQLQAQIQQLEASVSQIDAGLEQIAAGEGEIASGEEQLQAGYSQYYSGRQEAEAGFAQAEEELRSGEDELTAAEEELAEVQQPDIYVQTRADNEGYDSFDSNSQIVDGIAKIFPVFFFLIAALVCSTTMTRMIEDERTQIGAFRALGYTKGAIMFKYMVYSGSAAVIGCLLGFFAGSKYFPEFIWIAYGMMFGFAPLEYHFHWQLALISLAVSLLCSIGTTYLACRGQLKGSPAEILRPHAPKSGKRIFLEKIPFIWSRLKFLHKVSARNVFRYKKRMFMMILGIGGCTALVLTGFGLRDSVAGIADHQYEEIEKYTMAVGFSEEITDQKLEELTAQLGNEIKSIAVLQQSAVNAETEEVSQSCSLMVTGDENITKAVSFKDMEENRLSYPKEGEGLINNKLASILGVEKGDTITVEYDDTKTVELTVSGVYKNYVSNYIYISDETYERVMGKDYEPSALFVTLRDSADVHRASEEINGIDGVAAVSVNQDVRAGVDDMMVSLNYVIILVVGCAGALAFIVLFNLGNINITERTREIATIKVLGFYPRETGAYVFRENLVLVIMGIIVGIPAGLALHKFVMAQIVVDMVSFNEVIEPASYLFTVLAVIGFDVIVDIIMRRKLRRINMAEALKSIE